MFIFLRGFFSPFLLGLFITGIPLAEGHAAISASVTAPLAPDANADASTRLMALRAEIAHHDSLYFQKAKSEISDAAYDRLKRELAELETDHPELAVAHVVTDDRSALFHSYRHRAPLLSLEKAYTENEIRDFTARVSKRLSRDPLSYVIEPKVDGLSVSVTYDHGRLVRAATRGNGREGDDITAHAPFLRNLPSQLKGPPESIPDVIELRGEIYVPLAEFQRINHEREAADETPFANPRNLAAGTIRQLNSSAVAERGLAVIFYGFAACTPAVAAPRSQLALHQKLRDWGLPAFEPARVRTAENVDALWEAIQAVGLERAHLSFPTDGAVIKLDDVSLQETIGASSTAPRWAIAYKFTPDQVETRIRDITIQVGRTGVLTPVAELDPVMISGTKVARATLHNHEEIFRKDIRIGDTVYLEKAGEIIPAIISVDLERRPLGSAPYIFPSVCPVCHTPISVSENEVAIRCPNYACAAQVQRRLEHFASKSGAGIDGLGPTLIAALVEAGTVKDIADLYRLRAEDLHLPGRPPGATADKILAAIAQSKHIELWRFLRALGITGVGEAAAREIAEHFDDLSSLAAATLDDFDGVSERTSQAVITYFQRVENRAMIAALIANGVEPRTDR